MRTTITHNVHGVLGTYFNHVGGEERRSPRILSNINRARTSNVSSVDEVTKDLSDIMEGTTPSNGEGTASNFYMYNNIPFDGGFFRWKGGVE